MLNSVIKSNTTKIITSFVSIILFVYILLFEFILPSNSILPKPTILFDSIISLFNDYGFLTFYLYTLSLIYFIIIISYFLLNLFSSIGIKFITSFPGLKEISIIGKYFIPLFLIFLFNFWFGSSIWGESFFIFIVTQGLLKTRLFKEVFLVKQDYILAAKSINVKEKDLFKKIIWRSVQPKIFDEIISNNITIWSMVIIYEYICQTDGIGKVLSQVIEYNDISVMMIIVFVMILTFIISEIILDMIRKKYFFWA